MPRLWGANLSREELLRRVGQLSQVAGVRLVELADGLGRGVRLLEFRTGTGLSFDVLVDRAFDIGRCELGGRNLTWTSGPGVVGPWYYETDDWGWFRAWGGGLLVTCGLDHTMNPARDSAAAFHQPHMFETVRYPLHGRVGGLPARLVGYGETWEDDDTCLLWAEGEVRQSSVFLENLVLRRRIEARVGENSIHVHDEVVNAGHSATSHMLIYHCNLGYPLVDAGSEIVISSAGVTTDPWQDLPGYTTLTGPTPAFQEACFYESVIPDATGTVRTGLVNRRLGLGLSQTFAIGQLSAFMVWRMMGEGTYAVALEPGTNRAVPRDTLRQSGELTVLSPGEGRSYDLKLAALDGEAEIEGFAAAVAAIGAGDHG